MPRRGSFRGRSAGISDSQRRKKSWIALGDEASPTLAGFFLFPSGIGSPGESQALLRFDAAGAFPSLIESTILRMRGYVDVPKSILTNAATATVEAVGIGFVTTEASFAVGGVPNPASLNGAEWDGWMFLRSSSQVSVDNQGTLLDIKAMRKWQSGTSLVIVHGFSTQNAAGHSSTGSSWNLRALFLLP